MPPTGLSSEPDRARIAALLADDAPYLPVRQYLTDATAQIAERLRIPLAPHQQAPYVCVPTGWEDGYRYQYRYVALVENVSPEDVIAGHRTRTHLLAKWQERHSSRSLDSDTFKLVCDEAFRLLVEHQAWRAQGDWGPIQAALSAEPFGETNGGKPIRSADPEPELKLLTSRMFHEFDQLRADVKCKLKGPQVVYVRNLYTALESSTTEAAFFHAIERLALTALGSSHTDRGKVLAQTLQKVGRQKTLFQAGILGVIRAFGQPRALAVWFAPSRRAPKLCEGLEVALHAAERLLEQMLLQRVTTSAYPSEKETLGPTDLQRALQQAWTTRAVAPQSGSGEACGEGSRRGALFSITPASRADRGIAHLKINSEGQTDKFGSAAFTLHLDPPLAGCGALDRAVLLLNTSLESGAEGYYRARERIAAKAKAEAAELDYQIRQFQAHALTTQITYVSVLLNNIIPHVSSTEDEELAFVETLRQLFCAEDGDWAARLSELQADPNWHATASFLDVLKSTYLLVSAVSSSRDLADWLGSPNGGHLALGRLLAEELQKVERNVRAARVELQEAQSQNTAVLRLTETPPLVFAEQRSACAEPLSVIVSTALSGALTTFLDRAVPILLDRLGGPDYVEQAHFLFRDLHSTAREWIRGAESLSRDYRALSSWLHSASSGRVHLKDSSGDTWCTGDPRNVVKPEVCSQSPSLFRAVLQEVFFNALKYFSPTHGRPFIDVVWRLDRDGSLIHLAVSNTSDAPPPSREGAPSSRDTAHFGRPFIRKGLNTLFPFARWETEERYCHEQGVWKVCATRRSDAGE